MRNRIINSMAIPKAARAGYMGHAAAMGAAHGAAMAHASHQNNSSGNGHEEARLPRRGSAPTRGDGRTAGIGTDIVIRILGLSGMTLSIAIIRWLLGYARQHPAADAPLWLLAIIAAAFLGASVGCGLVALGRHIYDQIEIAERWRRHF